MGVDFECFIGHGLTIPHNILVSYLNKLRIDINDFEEKIDDCDNMDYVSQDNYGNICKLFPKNRLHANNKNLENYLGHQIFIGNNETILYNSKVGFTPMDFLQHGIYLNENGNLRGGSRIPMALNITNYDNESKKKLELLYTEIVSSLKDILNELKDEKIDMYEKDLHVMLDQQKNMGKWIFSHYE